MASPIKKGINIWSFDAALPLEECMRLAKKASFDGIEPALTFDCPLGLNSTDGEILAIGECADRIGIELCSLATGLFWQYSMTSSREDIRRKAQDIVKREIDVAALLNIDCVLVCPGAVGVDFKPGEVVPDSEKTGYYTGCEVIDYDIAYERARDTLAELAPYAGQKNVTIGVENIWNKFLLSPLEMRNFLDEIGSPFVGAYLDVGNMMLFGYPQHWIKILNKRIKKVHFKDYRREAGGLSGFVDLLAGDVDWDKVMEAFGAAEYSGWAIGEMCPTYRLHSDQMIYNCSASMDRILGRGETRPQG